MNNLLSYCGLVGPRISDSDKDLPFTDTLDKILDDEDNSSMKKTKAKKQPLKAKPVKQKQVKDQMLKDMSIFQQVLAHPEYNKNPLNTISTHIENKMLMEAAMDD